MGQLHDATEVAHLTGEHQPGALHQLLLDELGVEERRGDLRPAVLKRDDEILASRRAIGQAEVGLLNLVDEGDVLAFFRRFGVLAEHRHAVAVLARVVAKQIVDGANAENVVQ